MVELPHIKISSFRYHLFSIITTLETLKKEAADVTRKVEETDQVMAEVEMVSQQYLSLAQSCSSIYFSLEALNLVRILLEIMSQGFETIQLKGGRYRLSHG